MSLFIYQCRCLFINVVVYLSMSLFIVYLSLSLFCAAARSHCIVTVSGAVYSLF